MSEVTTHRHHRDRTAIVRWLLGLVVGFAAVWVAITVAGGIDDATDAIGAMRVGWLFAAFVIEVLSYGVLGVKIRDLVGPDVIGPREGIELGLVLSGFGPLAPVSPAEGIALASTHLRRRGVAGRTIAMALALSEWLSIRVFLLVSAVNLIVVAVIERQRVSTRWSLVVLSVVLLALYVLVGRLAVSASMAGRLAAMAGALRRRGRRHRVEERRAAGVAWLRDAQLVAGSARHRARLVALTATAMLADVACLWCVLRAGGAGVGYDVALLAVSVSAVAVLMPLVPGGLGIVEAAIPAVTQRFGVPYDDGLAAALVYRTFASFVPAGAGLLAIVTLRSHLRAPAP